MERGDSKRKQTLISLLDALNELNKDGDLDNNGHLTNFEHEHDGPTVDGHLQTAGAEAFHKFQRRIENLDTELRNFANASRQLGSSVGILSSSSQLRERFAQLLFLFRDNAADLFPRKVARQSKEAFINPITSSHRKKARHRVSPHVIPIAMEDLDAEHFPKQLGALAQDVMSFLRCLNEFPEFTDEAVNNSISLFEGDLQYWASCLKAYEGQFKFAGVKRYLHDISEEMGDHLDTITSSLSMFLEIGIPTIRFAQKHAATNLLNLTTVATLFSAVTATTLQFSFNQHGTPLTDSVNAFWFGSLVFSIASAVNSLLGLTWLQAMYRSPGHRVPWWVLIWIKRSPLIFLVVSVAAFSIGLCMFAYSSGQNIITAVFTTVFTGISSFGLIAVSFWFAFERWTYNHHQGKKWLMDVLTEFLSDVFHVPPIDWMARVPSEQAQLVTEQLRNAGTALTRVSSRISGMATRPSQDDTESPPISPAQSNKRFSFFQTTLTPPSPTTTLPSAPLGMTGQPSTAPSSITAASLDAHSEHKDTDRDSITGTTAKMRFTNAVRTVMTLRSASVTSLDAAVRPTLGSRRATATTLSHSERRQRRENSEPASAMHGSRASALIPALKGLEPTQDLPPHLALVRHLQFSPNGKYLATCSWDHTCVVFNVDTPFTIHRILAHPQGFVGQVAWSPSGDLLLTKLNRGVKVWTGDSGVCRKTIDRHRPVQSITWCPDGETFLCVEDGTVTKLNVHGKVLDSFHFSSMKVHDVVVTPDCQRLLGVATLTATAEGIRPSKSRAEKQIFAYNLDRKEIENQVPVLHDVRDITLANNGNAVLVSYENKAPPQLWRLEMVKDRYKETTIARLTLRHTYMPKIPVDFAGPSYFGGKNDQLVLCAGKSGYIHIWERDTSILLHHFRAQTHDGDLTCIAWNHSVTAFMFATGSHDGAVRVWTTPPSSSTPVDIARRPSTSRTNTARSDRVFLEPLSM